MVWQILYENQQRKNENLSSSAHRLNKNKTNCSIKTMLHAAVGCQQFRKRSRKRQTRIMFQRYYSFLHHWLLFLGYLMFPKNIYWVYRNGGSAQASVRGQGPLALVATVLSMSPPLFEKFCLHLWTRPVLRLGNTAPFKEMSQRWQAAGNSVYDLTGSNRRFEFWAGQVGHGGANNCLQSRNTFSKRASMLLAARGAKTRGEWGDISLHNLTVSPPILWVWSTSAPTQYFDSSVHSSVASFSQFQRKKQSQKR